MDYLFDAVGTVLFAADKRIPRFTYERDEVAAAFAFNFHGAVD